MSGFVKSKKFGDKDFLLFSYTDALQNQIIDTIFIHKNKFTIKGNLQGATMGSISMGKLSDNWDDNNSVHFFLEPGKLKLLLNEEDIQKTEILGSKTQIEYKKLESQTDDIYLTLDPLILKRNELVKISKEGKNPSVNLEIEKINAIQKIKLQQIKDLRMSFVETNYKSYLSSYWLNFYIKELPLDYVKLYYNKFSENVKNNFYAQKILEHLKRADATILIKTGEKLPNFKLKDIKGNDISLDSFRGKKFLIVFWASWCGPCREEIPFLKDLHTKYYSSKFDIISISLDENEADWAKAIREDAPKWIQLLDLKGFKSDLINQLNIKAIPDYILIDAEGRLVNKGFNKNELEDIIR